MPKPNQAETEQAMSTVLAGIHAPVFFAKLAERGYKPQTDAETQTLLQLGFRLNETNQKIAAAESTGNRFEQSLTDLSSLLKHAGYNAGDELEQATDEFLNIPELRKAAETLLAAG